jgi:predicted metal-binding protein
MGTVPRLANFGLWNAKLGEKPTKVHIAPCVTQHCPYSETIINKIKATTAVEVIEGTHPFMPENIYG